MTQPHASANPSETSLPLASKVALVTGGSRGIGAGIVRRLVRDGAAVAFTYAGNEASARALTTELERAGGRALAIQADSGDPEAVRRAVTATVTAFGRLDILVNNAGMLRMGALTDATAEDIERMLAVNVRGPLIATQEALRHMTQGGRVIHIGSVNSGYVPFPGISLYALTKGAISGLTHGLARELGARGITINNIQPGPVDTDMNPASGPMAEQLSSMIALGRYGHTREVAGLVAYLASDEGGYVTGADLRIDGGFSA